MGYQIFQKNPILEIDEVEITRLRPIYFAENLQLLFSNSAKKTSTFTAGVLNYGATWIQKFAPKSSIRREIFKRFWKYIPRSSKVRIMQNLQEKANYEGGISLIESFNIDSGFGIKTSDNPLVSIIIPVHNNLQLTLKCLRALQLNRDNVQFEVIVVNDASTDWTRIALANLRGIKVVEVKKNVGYLRATNIGILESSGKYVALLNNDTIPLEGWLDRLVLELESDATIGIAGSKLLYPSMEVQELGSQIFNDASGWNLGHGASNFSSEHSFTREVDYVSAAAILVRKDLLEITNGFDELFIPAYYEDADLAMQARQHGLKVIAVHDSLVIHLGGGTHGSDLKQGIKRHQQINKEKFLKKWSTELLSHWDSKGGPRIESKRDSKGIVIIYDSQTPQNMRDAGSQRATQIACRLCDIGFHVIYFSQNRTISNIDVMRLRDLGIEVHTDHDKLCSTLDSRLNRIRGIWMQRISVAQLFFAAVAKKIPNVPIIFDTVDLVSNRIRKELEMGLTPEMQLGQALKLEDTFTRKADLTITVSNEEKLQLQERVKSGNFETLWMGFNTKKFWEANRPLSNSGLFVGNFRHQPNKQALLWFVEEVLPKILLHDNTFVLNVVGMGLSPEEKKKVAVTGVKLLGFVDNLSLFYENSKVIVLPLQYGAGIKGKMCEALSNSSAIVSTSYGSEGLLITPGIEFLLAESAEMFANHVLSILVDDALRDRLSKAAFEYAKSNLSHESFKLKIQKIAKIFE